MREGKRERERGGERWGGDGRWRTGRESEKGVRIGFVELVVGYWHPIGRGSGGREVRAGERDLLLKPKRG